MVGSWGKIAGEPNGNEPPGRLPDNILPQKQAAVNLFLWNETKFFFSFFQAFRLAQERKIIYNEKKTFNRCNC